MIEAKDLRIGSVIYKRYFNPTPRKTFEFTACVVVSILDSTIYYRMRGDKRIFRANISGFEPIPLTEEILLKCGFTKNYEYKQLYCINKFGYDINEKTISLEEYRNIFFRVRTISIEHLHQLQNLYFALTGEELEINL